MCVDRKCCPSAEELKCNEASSYNPHCKDDCHIVVTLLFPVQSVFIATVLRLFCIILYWNTKKKKKKIHFLHVSTIFLGQGNDETRDFVQGVPLATEPGISLIILKQIKILQRNRHTHRNSPQTQTQADKRLNTTRTKWQQINNSWGYPWSWADRGPKHVG